MGVLIEPEKITKETFGEALNEVLSNPKYGENAKKIQFILEDQPMKSRDLFLYWVNYTMRHKGADHLISDAPFELNALQYWSVDIVAFLSGIPVVSVIFLSVLVKSCRGKHDSIKLKEKKRKWKVIVIQHYVIVLNSVQIVQTFWSASFRQMFYHGRIFRELCLPFL